MNDIVSSELSEQQAVPMLSDDDEGASLLEHMATLAENLRLLILVPLAAGVIALGASYLVAPTFTASTTFLPPQQQQSVAASALASLGTLAGLATGSAGVRVQADQYVSLMQSVSVADRIIDKFKLMEVYDEKYRADARKGLASNSRFNVGKKDGLITIEVDDKIPQRAADIANQYVEELRRLTDTLAVTEAQQRRMFFEQQLQQTQQKLITAQQTLQASGLTQGALKAEPRTAAEGYARLKAEITATEVRLQVMRRTMADNAPEVQQLQSAVEALRGQLARLEQTSNVQGGPDYVSKYREFKYQETLFELFARQYELAKVDESREGALIQVVDNAVAPERKSKPVRSLIAIVTTLSTGVLLAGYMLIRESWRRSAQDPDTAKQMARLRAAFRRRKLHG
jgi:uncharacterized protein involved in exopolysaccharide biosynthesis